MAQTSEQSTSRTLPQVPANTISFGQKSGISDHRLGTTEQFHGMISYDRIPISCCTIDNNAFIRDVNESMCALFEFPMDALTQKSFVELVVFSSLESVEKILSGDSGGKSDRLMHPSGSELSVWFRKRDGTVFPGTMRIQSAEEHRNKLDGDQSSATS